MVNIMQHVSQNKNVRFKYESEVHPCSIRGHQDKLSQVLLNMMNNAMKVRIENGEIDKER